MTVTELPTADYTAAMTAPLVAVATTAGVLGIRPSYLQVNYNSLNELANDRPWQVTVQVDDVADADRLAAHYELPADTGSLRIYGRDGVAVFDGIGKVGVRVYTGRPTLPRYPLGYKPTAVAL